MNNNVVTNMVDICLPLVMDSFSGNLTILYYSHIPAIIISSLFGFFVLFKGGKSLLSKIFFAISLLLTAWSVLDLFTWLSWDSGVQMFAWSVTLIVEPIIFVASLYFVYVFIKKEDVAAKYKIIAIILILPLFVMLPTRYNLYAFNYTECYSLENTYALYYKYFVEIISSVTILLFTVVKLKQADKNFKKQILILLFGILFFLLSFFSAVFLGGFLAENGWQMTGFSFEVYGLFGAVVFMGFLAYLVVKFNAFNIKLLGAQALVFALVILIGAQFFFVQNNTSIVLTGVTLALSLGFGYTLIKSVKKEVERKEQLQEMADKLAQANDKLRKLDNAKTEFISIASHQLRTPITAIKGFTSLLLEGSYGEMNEAVHGALDKIYTSADRLVNLIEDLLNVSRIESGRMQFAFEKASVEKLIKELNDNFLLIAKTKKFFLDVKLPENPLPEIVMDYSKIRELVSNFVDNALKYTEKGGATIKAELRDEGVVVDEKGFVIEGQKSPFGKVVRITVSDTGIGIPKEEIPYLFKKFSRGKDVSRLHVGGTGLGLYVGKAIAEAHHGQVWVESDGAGLGSRFIIEIPVSRAD